MSESRDSPELHCGDYASPSVQKDGKQSLDDNEFMELCDNFTPSTKLEVLTAKQFNRLTLLIAMTAFITLSHVVVLSSLCNTVWFAKSKALGLNGEKIEIARCLAPLTFKCWFPWTS